MFAAASLTGAFNDEKTTLATSAPGLSLTYNFAGSQALVTQIQQGAPADVFASADTKNMQKLVDAGLVETPKTFARNKLEIAVAPGNPKNITGLADLEKPGRDAGTRRRVGARGQVRAPGVRTGRAPRAEAGVERARREVDALEAHARRSRRGGRVRHRREGGRRRR